LSFCKIALVAGAGGVTVESIMKTLPDNGKVSGFTLIEVLAVLAILAILAALLLPAQTHGGKARIPWCMSNQKQSDIRAFT
jgi:prepilin-type N-terminal cleavage/methylation domain-containing protein